MSTALKELVANKATITYHRDDVTEEMILSGMGANHLEIFKERLKNGFNVEIGMTEPKVPYKQSIAKEADTKYRHKKQSGGRGQYGEVYLRLSPTARGSGFEFVNEIKGGNIPTQFIPGVEKGIEEALDEEYPITDVKATVYDGDHHPVDSSEMAFKIAGREACNKAVEQAGPILLEPIMKVKVTTPGDFTGDIISDLNGRRGKIMGSDTSEGYTVIEAEVPQAEVMNYATRLKSLTQAKASFQMEFVRYKKVPSNIASDILDR
jgi:elongation factor G